jgi:hypothetical protein
VDSAGAALGDAASYFVPVSPICSRITQSSGVSGSTSTVWTVPFTLSLAIISLSRIEIVRAPAEALWSDYKRVHHAFQTGASDALFTSRERRRSAF